MVRCTFTIRDTSPFVGQRIRALEKEYKIDVVLYSSGDSERSTILYAGKTIAISGVWENVKRCVDAEVKE
jgi:hypothetical protein